MIGREDQEGVSDFIVFEDSCFHFPHCAFPPGETYIERKGCGRQLG